MQVGLRGAQRAEGVAPQVEEAERDAGAEPARPSLRPVPDGILTLAALLDRYEHPRGELVAVATDTAELITELTDPTALDREIAEIQRDAPRRITAAEQARADAEQATAAMRERFDRAVELENLAIAAAGGGDRDGGAGCRTPGPGGARRSGTDRRGRGGPGSGV
ncbi:hypothetical protein [Nocardia asiatica]|uniref:hypothetical protein n=1 Tax=Nocardia asiatica TaxID=209252 RepID=UPI0024590F94|nr:hypothetical protein [Nocardia asiatica]